MMVSIFGDITRCMSCGYYVDPLAGPPAAIARISSRDNDERFVLFAALAAAARAADALVFDDDDPDDDALPAREASTRQLAAATAADDAFNGRLAAGFT
jgi:hypothetical protein